jgi:hypothetical protein
MLDINSSRGSRKVGFFENALRQTLVKTCFTYRKTFDLVCACEGVFVCVCERLALGRMF